MRTKPRSTWVNRTDNSRSVWLWREGWLWWPTPLVNMWVTPLGKPAHNHNPFSYTSPQPPLLPTSLPLPCPHSSKLILLSLLIRFIAPSSSSVFIACSPLFFLSGNSLAVFVVRKNCLQFFFFFYVDGSSSSVSSVAPFLHYHSKPFFLPSSSPLLLHHYFNLFFTILSQPFSFPFTIFHNLSNVFLPPLPPASS